MEGFKDQEARCSHIFDELGEVYHLYTPENFELIFSGTEDFKRGMSIFGICCKLFASVRVLTFQLMSNHIHIAAAGALESLQGLFALFKSTLERESLSMGHPHQWEKFTPGIRKLETLSDIRNVIVYDNKNGYLVHPEHTPYTYPWGANRYYFNPDARKLALGNAVKILYRERRQIMRSHRADDIEGLMSYEGYALPLSFCEVSLGESLFRTPSHYHESLSRSIERNAKIVAEIGESVAYTDEELFSALVRISRQKFDCPIPSQVASEAKLQLAATMRYDYNASDKQISRMLKLDPELLRSILRR